MGGGSELQPLTQIAHKEGTSNSWTVDGNYDLLAYSFTTSDGTGGAQSTLDGTEILNAGNVHLLTNVTSGSISWSFGSTRGYLTVYA